MASISFLCVLYKKVLLNALGNSAYTYDEICINIRMLGKRDNKFKRMKLCQILRVDKTGFLIIMIHMKH